ncbi:hypothetical protein F5B21DRAFT_514744 [Xylaria acuta]|nr:hypothetical protein F5B21DRAFT_514744 [Xylaria acuta]
MFPIDVTLLPPLTTRKALLVVDAQNDFLAEDGALPVRMPIDLPQRISELAGEFRRSGGEIIWVQSRFESSRPVDEEQIMISDTSSPSPGSAPAPPRGRRPRTTPPAAPETILSPEAFLTPGPGNGPTCVRVGTPGIEMHPTVRQAVGPRDHVLTKTFYSAFKVDELLRLLRMRLVTELFICGSSTSIGVMATATDAASHGCTITIVDDCCGSQSMSGHRAALRQIVSTTGCKILSAVKVLGSMATSERGMDHQQQQQQHHHHHHRDRGAAGGRAPTVRLRRGMGDAVAPSSVSDIQPSLERLSLSGEPAAADEYAPETALASPPPQQQQQRQQRQRQRRRQPQSQSQSQPRSQPESQPALQSVARSGHPPTKNQQTDRDTGVESLTTTTTSNASGSASLSRASSSESSSSEKSPAAIKTRRDDDDEEEAASEPLCEGDTKVIYSILPASMADSIFTRLRDEVAWQRMSHQGGEVPRLVAVQGLVTATADDDDDGDEGSKPVYRHPADASPPLRAFTPSVDAVRRVVEEALGHELNHVLIQLYRGGEDYISEHSDKTLDIARDSFIANVSLGAERTMTLRTKRRPKNSGSGSGSGSEGSKEDGKGKGKGTGGDGKEDPLKRSVQRATLPHNSLFQMGLATNMRWLHGVRADKRPEREKSAAELACDGARISLTFRRIATYLDAEETKIWGQGATAKTRDAARAVVNGQTDQAVAMLRAFGRENQDAEFDWETHYGGGFDVLHIGDAKRLFLSGDPVVDLRVRAMLAEFGVSYARGSLGGGGGSSSQGAKTMGGGGPGAEEEGKSIDIPLRFVDNDANKTAVDGQREVMLYLQKTYGETTAAADNNKKERWTRGLEFLHLWRPLCSSPSSSPSKNEEKIKALLDPWEKYASEDVFIAGPDISLADFAFWPVLSDIFSSSPLLSGEDDSEVPYLRAYHERMRAREGIARLLGA